MPRVFEKFFRGRPAASASMLAGSNATAADFNEAQGIGLGLYLARTIVEQLRARITAESKLEGGATFSVYVPRSDDEMQACEQPQVVNDRRIDVEATARS